MAAKNWSVKKRGRGMLGYYAGFTSRFVAMLIDVGIVIALVFTIPQDDIPRVQKRMREGHQLTVDAYDRDFKTKLASGKLIAIDDWPIPGLALNHNG